MTTNIHTQFIRNVLRDAKSACESEITKLQMEQKQLLEDTETWRKLITANAFNIEDGARQILKQEVRIKQLLQAIENLDAYAN